jgi:outer membrane protein assembly factor BamB
MGTVTRRRAAVAALLAAALGVYAVPSGEAAATCAPSDAMTPGGEWRGYGHDLANSRTQPEETRIGARNVRNVRPAWIHSSQGGLFNNTPLVADGCVYLADSNGTVSAHNADTGAIVWSRKLPTEPAAFGGGLVATPAIDGPRLYILVNQLGRPYLHAFDRATGATLWEVVLDDQTSAMTNSSPVAFAGMVFAGFSGSAGAGSRERGGYIIVDAITGELLTKQFVIDDASFQQGFAGAGIWSTPAVDLSTGYAYVGTSNPHSPQDEHERADALLKIDVDRTRPTFGTIVDHYKGLPDTYVAGLADQPLCDLYPGAYYFDRFSASCVQVDLDFGASPSLYRSGDKTLLADLQKAGVLHAVDPVSMEGVWKTIVGVPCLACNAASQAASNGSVFTAAGPPGQLFRLNGGNGFPRWVGLLTGVTTYNPVSVANGIVYAVDGLGFLNGFVAENGLPVLKRNMTLDIGAPAVSASSSSGIAIARNTLYVAVTGHVLAYRLGGDGGAGGGSPELPELPGLPGGGVGTGTPILAGPGSFAVNYLTPVAIVQQGGAVTYVNLDLAQHDVVSTEPGLFRTDLISTGQTTTVAGVEDLDAGSYGFYCTLHPNMRGTLRVI